MKSSVIRCACWMALGAALWVGGGFLTSLAVSHTAHGHSAPDQPAGGKSAVSAVSSVPKALRIGSDMIVVPAELALKIGLETAPAHSASHPLAFPSFHGVLALDPDCLSHVHARFGGEIVEIGQIAGSDGTTRPIRVGDHVEQGDLLAVVWSTDLGAKKSELCNALARLRAEEELRDRLKKLATEGASPKRNYRDAEKDVQSRLVEVANAERTLRTWRMTDEDIEKIKAEVDQLSESHVPDGHLNDWARVEVRAAMSGVILEKNIAIGAIVDTALDLFKIGDTSRLAVWAHVFEEDLLVFEALPRPIPWTVVVPSRSGSQFRGTLDRIGEVIDQSQHTALVTGRVENPTGDLRVGQFVTVTIELPPSQEELELPVAAVVEDGRQSVVFTSRDADTHTFVLRAVHVIRRSRHNIYIRSEADGVHPGEFVVTAGALMIKNAMDQLAVPPVAAPTGPTTAAARPPESAAGLVALRHED